MKDLLDRESGIERAVRNKTVSAAWRKWREISCLLVNRSVPVVRRARVYYVCIRLAMLYGSEGWPMTDRLKEVLTSCDRRLLRYINGISLLDHVRSEEVADRSGIEPLEVVMRRRQRWNGHLRRRNKEKPLDRIMELTVEGRGQPGRPKKS